MLDMNLLHENILIYRFDTYKKAYRWKNQTSAWAGWLGELKLKPQFIISIQVLLMTYIVMSGVARLLAIRGLSVSTGLTGSTHDYAENQTIQVNHRSA
jgi:hypothetical protein